MLSPWKLAKIEGQGLHDLATALASYAQEHNFESHQGCYTIGYGEAEILVIYDNAPDNRGPQYRVEELGLFRAHLADQRIRELAFASYPAAGEENAGYSYAMLIDMSDPDEIKTLIDTFHKIKVAVGS